MVDKKKEKRQTCKTTIRQTENILAILKIYGQKRRKEQTRKSNFTETKFEVKL